MASGNHGTARMDTPPTHARTPTRPPAREPMAWFESRRRRTPSPYSTRYTRSPSPFSAITSFKSSITDLYIDTRNQGNLDVANLNFCHVRRWLFGLFFRGFLAGRHSTKKGKRKTKGRQKGNNDTTLDRVDFLHAPGHEHPSRSDSGRSSTVLRRVRSLDCAMRIEAMGWQSSSERQLSAWSTGLNK